METQPGSPKIYAMRVNQAVAYIAEHLAEDLSLEQVARAACFSPFHFHRIFKELVGETPHEFVQRLRLERAANMLLKMPGLTVAEVALACGFSSPAVFARSFREHFGMPARVYRRDGRDVASSFRRIAKPALPDPSGVVSAIRLQFLPALHLAYVVSAKGYSLPAICAAWETLQQWAAARSAVTAGTRLLGISLDDPAITRPDRCRYYACMTVPPATRPDGTVQTMDTPEGPYAVARLSCRGEEIAQGYRVLYGLWFPGSQFQPGDGPAYELYHATPDSDPAGRYVLDLCIPARPL